MKQVVMLNKEMCIKLAGLAGAANAEWIMVEQDFPEKGQRIGNPVKVTGSNGDELREHMVTTIGTVQRLA